MYMQTSCASSAFYDFRHDFSAIATPGLHRYLRECGYDPDEPSSEIDDCWESGKVYVAGLFRGLKSAQSDYREFGQSPDLEVYAIKDWSRESVAAYVERRLEGILDDVRNPVEWDEVVETGQRLDREHAAAEKSFIEKLRAVAGVHIADEPEPSPFASAGGLLQQVAEWILSASIIPCEELSMMAAVAAMSAFMGRRYVGPTGLAPNLYLVGLAKTGAGKDGPLSALRRFLLGSPFMGGDDLVSDAVIERTVREQPACVCPMDEVGAWLQEATRRGAAAHVAGRRKMLLKLYSQSSEGGIFLGRDRAGSEVLSSKEPVISPCFSIFGVSTESLFFKGITEENTTDGFLNRLTVMRIPEIEEPDELPEIERNVPLALRNALDDAFDAWPVKGDLARGGYRHSGFGPVMHTVPFANDGAKDAFTSVRRAQKAMVKADPENRGIYARRGEQALKIAMIRAVSRDFARPSIAAEDIRWADAIVERSCNLLASGIREHMSGSEFESSWKLLLKHVNEAGPKGLTATKLQVRPGVGKIKPRDFKEAIDYLTNTGRWEQVKHPKRKGQFRYVALGDREAVEAEE